MSTHLATRKTVVEIVAIYEQAERDIRAAFAKIASAEKTLNDTITLDGPGNIYVRQDHRTMRWGDVDNALEHVQRDVWAAIVERLGLRRIMSIGRAKELDRQLQSGELPPITVDNVIRFGRTYGEMIPEMHAEAVAEVFDWLRPRDHHGWGRDRYKTNQKSFEELDRKVILERMVEWEFGKWRVAYHYAQNFVALENVFQALDGQGLVNKTWRSALQNAIEASPREGRGETDYFRFRCFKNRNLHIEFTRVDLLKRFNEIAGGKRLKTGG